MLKRKAGDNYATKAVKDVITGAYEIIEQREQTAIERKQRIWENSGSLCAICLFIEMRCTAFYKHELLWLMLGIGSITFVAAIYFYFIDPRGKKITKVNRIRSTILTRNKDTNQLVLDENLLITYPVHWKKILPN